MAAHILIELDCGFNRGFDFGIDTLAIVLSWYADFEAGQARFESANIVADRRVARGCIVRISAGHDGQHSANVLGAIGKGSDLVQRRSECNQSIAGDSSVSRLEPNDSTEACRLTDRSARVGTE